MRDDDEQQQLKIELLSQWKLEAESRNFQEMYSEEQSDRHKGDY